MSKTEILTELPNLTAEERSQILQRLCELQEQDVLQGQEPTPEEKKLLDQALAEYEQDRDPGIPWREALHLVRSTGRK